MDTQSWVLLAVLFSPVICAVVWGAMLVRWVVVRIIRLVRWWRLWRVDEGWAEESG